MILAQNLPKIAKSSWLSLFKLALKYVFTSMKSSIVSIERKLQLLSSTFEEPRKGWRRIEWRRIWTPVLLSCSKNQFTVRCFQWFLTRVVTQILFLYCGVIIICRSIWDHGDTSAFLSHWTNQQEQWLCTKTRPRDAYRCFDSNGCNCEYTSTTETRYKR